MSAANGTQRDIGLDLTRILAFLAVPSVHFFLNSTYYDTAIVGPRMALMTVMRTAFMVCVPLYMLLSGYLSAEKHIPLTRSGLLGYYKKLLPIFLTYALSTGVILLYRVLWLGEEQTIRSAVKNLPAVFVVHEYVLRAAASDAVSQRPVAESRHSRRPAGPAGGAVGTDRAARYGQYLPSA